MKEYKIREMQLKILLPIILVFFSVFCSYAQYSFDFDGNDGYALLDTTGYNNTQSGAVSVWFYLQGTGSNYTLYAQSVSAVVTLTRFKVYYQAPNHRLAVEYWNAGGTQRVTRGNTVLSENTWYHAVFESNGAVWKISLNGVAEELTAAVGANAGYWFADRGDDNITIGGGYYNNQLYEPFDGYITDIATFSDTLTRAEITTIYNGGYIYDLTGFNNLVDWYKFDEGTGSTISSADGGIVLDTVGTGTWVTNPSAPEPANFYVDVEGNDSNEGITIALPWRTISKLNGYTFVGPQFIDFRTDDTWREQLIVPSSGTSGNPITFTCYDSATGLTGAAALVLGDTATISGADLVSTWVGTLGAELLTNPDAETYTSPPWFDWSSPDTRDSSSTQAHGGTYSSEQITSTTGSGLYIATATTVASSRYRASIWLYISSSTADSIIFEVVNSGPYTRLAGPTGTTTTGSWVNVTLDFTAIDVGSAIRVLQYGSGGATFYVDDVSIKLISDKLYTTGISTEPKVLRINGAISGEAEANSAAVDSQGEWFWTGSPDSLFVFTSDTTLIEAGQRPYGIYNDDSADYITIDGIQIEGCNFSSLRSDDNDNWIIQNCTMRDSYYGHIFGNGTTDGDSLVGWVVQNNSLLNVIVLDASVTTAGVRLWGAYKPQINNNYIQTNNVTGIALSRWNNHTDDSGAGSVGALVYENEITGCQNGVLVFYTDSARVYRNYIHDGQGIGISSSFYSDAQWIYNNIIWDLDKSHSAAGTYNGVDINFDSNNGYLLNNTIGKVYNTCFTIEADSAASDNWTVKNNIFDARDNYVHFYTYTASIFSPVDNTTLSNNLYIDDDDTIAVYHGQLIKTIEEWADSTGATNYVNAAPLFTDAANDDFTLKPNSPAIDIGTDVGLVLDYAGNIVPAPVNKRLVDIGAYEFQLSFGYENRYKRYPDYWKYKRY